jgi:hypothetical protein
MPLIRTTNLEQPDVFYAELVAAQRGMGDEEAALFQAKLLLVLANHVGELAVLRQALAVAAGAAAPADEALRPNAAPPTGA